MSDFPMDIDSPNKLPDNNARDEGADPAVAELAAVSARPAIPASSIDRSLAGQTAHTFAARSASAAQVSGGPTYAVTLIY